MKPDSRQKFGTRAVAGLLLALTILGAGVALMHSHRTYQGLHISIELEGPTPNTYQLYYDRGKGYNDRDLIQAQVDSSHAGPVAFDLPPTKIINLRFDPGTRPGVIAIRKITLASGTRTTEITSKQLLAFLDPEQQVANLHMDKEVMLLSSTGPDPIMVVHDLAKYVGQEPQRTTPYIIPVLACALLLFLAVLFYPYLRANIASSHYRKMLTVTIVMYVVAQFSYIVYSVAQNAESLAIIDAGDWDGGKAIETVMKTRWGNDNGWMPYGNLYYRIAHTAERFNPLTRPANDALSQEQQEKSNHFSLMFISLVALLGIVFLLSLLLAQAWLERLIVISALTVCALDNHAWVTWVFRAHPDVLLSFLVAAGVFLSLAYITDGNAVRLWCAAAVWGMALAVKLNGIIFLPCLVVLFYPFFRKKSVINGVIFYAMVFLTYFAVGFPQNNKIEWTLWYMRNVSSLDRPPSAISVLRNLSYTVAETLPLLAAVVVISFCFVHWPSKIKVLPTLRGSLIVLFPFGYMLLRNNTMMDEHYFLPVSATLLVFGAYYGRYIPSIVYRRLVRKDLAVSRHVGLLLVFVISVLCFQRTVNAVSDVLAARTGYWPEAREVYRIVDGSQRDHQTIYVNPFVPYNRKLGGIIYSDAPTLVNVPLRETDLLVFNRTYMSQYQADYDWEESPFRGAPPHNKKAWQEVREFYGPFYQQSSCYDIYGQQWVTVQVASTGVWEIWKKVK